MWVDRDYTQTMKSLPLIVCLIFSCFVQAQCAFEKELVYYTVNLNQAKIIELHDGSSLTGMSVGSKPGIPESVSNLDIYLTKQDSCGSIIWGKKYAYNESSFDRLEEIVELPNNEIIMVTYSENDGIGGAYNIIVWKLNANGDVLWNKYYGGETNASSASSVFYNKTRNTILIAGKLERPSPSGYLQRGYLFEIDTAGSLLHERDIIINSVQYSTGARLLVRYAYTLPDASILAIATALSDWDSIYAVKLDSNFNLLWVKYPLLGTFRETTSNMSINTNKNKTRLALYFSSGSGDYVAELDSSATIVKYNKQFVDVIPSGNSQSIVPTKENGYILGYDLLIIDSNLQTKSFTAFHKDIAAQGYCQMNNGTIVYAGYKIVENGNYLKGYIAQTNEKGWVLAEDEINQFVEFKVELYPNPTHSILNINSRQKYSAIELINISGKVIFNTSYSRQIDVSNISEGLYILRLLGAQEEILAVKKLSIVR